MSNKKVVTQVPVIFQDMKEYSNDDTRFLKIKIWLLHLGKNLNGSIFTKECVEKALPTLANTPILSFIEENESGEVDFSDHRIVLHRSEDGETKLKYLGSAVGTIPETNNAKWENRVGDDGIEREYLTVEALMWKKWEDSTEIMESKQVTSQSMELSEEFSGFYDSEGYFNFETFSFFGACLLGKGVMPAMNSSSAEIHFSKNDNIKNTVEDKLQEFYTLFSQEGGNKMTKEKLEDVKLDEAVVEVAEVEFEEVIVEEIVLEETKDEAVADNSDENKAEVETEEILEEEVVLPVEEEVEKFDFEAKYNELVKSNGKLQESTDTLKTQLNELQSYKRTREEDDLKSKFNGKLSEEDFTSIFTEMKDVELEKVEEKLFALIGKKNFSIQVDTKVETDKISIKENKDVTASPYGSIFD